MAKVELSARRLDGPGLEMPLFSSTWYVDAYEDMAASGRNPFPHYVAAGWRENRDPSPDFSTARYLERHPEVLRVGLNPLIHCLGLGLGPGLEPGPVGTGVPGVDRSTATAAIVRHAFKRGRSPAEYVPFDGDDGDDGALRGLCAELAGVRLVVVIPFFRNEGLVEAARAGLLGCAGELAAQRACVLLVNDSPGHTPLGTALRAAADSLGGHGFDVVLFEAERNGGFVRSTNLGLRCADLLSCACLMLNSDATLRPGALTEMMAVAGLDDRFAFVSPLSNNATIATLGLGEAADAAGAAADHAAVAGMLPRYHVVPTCVGFCMLVRPEIVRLFGYLDPAYGQGYNEENDYVMRANRKGFLAVLAARAFASHAGEASFSAAGTGRAEREAANGRVLRERYPEFGGAVERYFGSPEAQARRVVERHARAVDVVLDLSGMPAVANGTSVLARELVHRLMRRLGPERCAVRCSADRLSALGLADAPGLPRWDPGEERFAKLGVRLSQPFERGDVAFLSDHAARIAVFMLDTISDDCLHLREARVRDLWEWVGEHADALLFNSPYSQDKFRARFAVDPRAVQCASYHSLDVGEYGRRRGAAAIPSAPSAPAPSGRPFLLIVGNHFQHKGIGMALDATEGIALPRVLVGAKLRRPNLLSFEAGRLHRGEVEFLYDGAAVVLFPSLYEGFGFPLLEGLAAGRPVIAHANALTRDIAGRLGSPPGLALFDSFAELPALIERMSRPGGRPADAARRGADGWDRSVGEIVGALQAALDAPLDYGRVLRRQKALSRLA